MDYNCGVYFPKTGKGYVSFVDPADDTWLERHLQHSERPSENTSDWSEFNQAANRRPLPQSMFHAGSRTSNSPPSQRDRRNTPPEDIYSCIGQRRPPQFSNPDNRDLYRGMQMNFPRSSSSGFSQTTGRNLRPSSGPRRFSSTANDALVQPANQKRFPVSMVSSFPAPSGNRAHLPESLFSTLPDQVPVKTKSMGRPDGGGKSSDRESTPTLDRASRRAILENVFLGQPINSSAFLSPSPPPSPGKKHKLKLRFPTHRYPLSLSSKHHKQQHQPHQHQQQMQHNHQQKEKSKKAIPQKKQGNGFSLKNVTNLDRGNHRPRQSLFAKVCFHCGTATNMAGSSARVSSPLPGAASHRDSRGSSNWSRLDLDTYGYDGIYGDIEPQGEFSLLVFVYHTCVIVLVKLIFFYPTLKRLNLTYIHK